MIVDGGLQSITLIPGSEALTYKITGPICDKATAIVFCPMHLFKIDTASGQVSVRVANILNVKLQESYDMTVVAVDPRGLTSTSNIVVRVIQSNDVPVIESRQLNIDENSKGVQIQGDV